MTRGTRNVILILLGIIFLFAAGGYFITHIFSNAYSPPEIIVAKNEISSSGGFMEPITIEKLKVDSFGKEKRPIKYTIEYVATCTIKQREGEQPVTLKEIKLNEPGRYSWSEENVNISIAHSDGFSKRILPTREPICSRGHQRFDICPLKFEKEHWYFINFLDPVFIGVYIYVTETGAVRQYNVYSKT